MNATNESFNLTESEQIPGIPSQQLVKKAKKVITLETQDCPSNLIHSASNPVLKLVRAINRASFISQLKEEYGGSIAQEYAEDARAGESTEFKHLEYADAVIESAERYAIDRQPALFLALDRPSEQSSILSHVVDLVIPQGSAVSAAQLALF